MSNKGKDYKDRINEKRRITYWLDHHNLGWIADIVRKVKVSKKGTK